MTDAIPNRATVCERCGSGLLDGKHIASYPPCNGEDAIPNRADELGWRVEQDSEGRPKIVYDADATRNRVRAWSADYLAGWRAAMTEARGGDWSKEYPDA